MFCFSCYLEKQEKQNKILFFLLTKNKILFFDISRKTILFFLIHQNFVLLFGFVEQNFVNKLCFLFFVFVIWGNNKKQEKQTRFYFLLVLFWAEQK